MPIISMFYGIGDGELFAGKFPKSKTRLVHA